MKKTYLIALLCGIYWMDGASSLVWSKNKPENSSVSEADKARKRAVKAAGGEDAIKKQTDEETAKNQQDVMSAKGDLIGSITEMQKVIDATASTAANAQEKLLAQKEMYEAAARESEAGAKLLKAQQELAAQRANLLYSSFLDKVMLMIDQGQYFAGSSPKITNAIVELKKLIATNQRMQDTKAKMETRIEEIKAQNRELSDLIESVKTEEPSDIVDSRKDEIEALNMRIAERGKDLERLYADHEANLKKIENLKGQKQAKDVAIAREKAAYISQKSAISNDIDRLQKSLASLQDALKSAEEVAASSKAELKAAIDKQVQSATKKMASNARALEALPAKIASYETSYQEGEQKIAERKAAIRDMLLAALEKSAGKAAETHENDIKGSGLKAVASKIHESRVPDNKKSSADKDAHQKQVVHG